MPITQQITLPSHCFPGMRTVMANEWGIHKNLLVICWGGLGDQVCAEPTIRYALKNFKECEVTVATNFPELFKHLPLKTIYDTKFEQPIVDDYLYFETTPRQTPDNLTAQFISHMLMNCVDFTSVSAFRMQLPIVDRQINIEPSEPANETIKNIIANVEKHVIVHPGRHWKSKTIPAAWYNSALESIKEQSFTPVLIGKHEGETQGYVDVDATGCIDLRDKTTIEELMWLLKNAGVVFCNDSGPMHVATAGNAWIGFLATVKHPDFITHWRKGRYVNGPEEKPIWSWRMEALNVDGIYNYQDYCPNKVTDLMLDDVEDEMVLKCLPDPKTIGPWCREKMDDYCRGF